MSFSHFLNEYGLFYFIADRAALVIVVAVGIAWILGERLLGERLHPAALWTTSPATIRILNVSGYACLGLTAATAILYFLEPFINHADAQVAAASAAVANGAPLYVSPDTAYRYSLLYGPLHYLLHAAVITASGHAIWSVKILGLINCLMSTAIIGLLVHKLRRDPILTAIASLSCGAVILYYAIASYAPRADSFMLSLTSMIALAFASNIRWSAKLFILALYSALLVNLKIHAAIPVVPLALVLLLSPDLKWKLVIPAAILFVITVALPYSGSQISLPTYFHILELAAHHGLSWRIWIGRVAPLGLLLVWVLWIGVPRFRQKPAGVAFAVCLFVTSVFASKAGSGATHLLPYIPVLLAILKLEQKADLSSTMDTSFIARRGLLVASILMGVFALISGTRNISTEFSRLRDGPHVSAELTAWLRKYNGGVVQILPGEQRSEHLDGLRYIPVLAGQPYFIDSASEMDFVFAGVPLSNAAETELLTCGNRTMLVPTGDKPLDLFNYYPPFDKLFPASLRAEFDKTWTAVATERYFTAYRCKPASSSVK